MDMVNDVRENLSVYVPGAPDADNVEVSGILWWQGWNDAFYDEMNKDYQANLIVFVLDLMQESGTANDFNNPILA